MTGHAAHLPLVAVTSLAIAGAGLVTAAAYFELIHGGLPAASTMAAGTALIGAGLLVSLAHLGRKRRAALAVRGAGRSALSNEALLAGFALASAAAAAAMEWSGSRVPVLTAIAGVSNAAFLVSIGLVYSVRGQRSWRGYSAVTPLTGGLAFGAIAVQTTAGVGAGALGTLLCVAADALIFSRRWRSLTAMAFTEATLANPWSIHRTPLLGARFFLLDVIPFFVLAVTPTPLAAASAAAGLIVDRFSFYILAVQHTTEYEIAGIEARMDSIDRPARD